MQIHKAYMHNTERIAGHLYKFTYTEDEGFIMYVNEEGWMRSYLDYTVKPKYPNEIEEYILHSFDLFKQKVNNELNKEAS